MPLKGLKQRGVGTCVVEGQGGERVNTQVWPEISSPFYKDLKLVKKVFPAFQKACKGN